MAGLAGCSRGGRPGRLLRRRRRSQPSPTTSSRSTRGHLTDHSAGPTRRHRPGRRRPGPSRWSWRSTPPAPPRTSTSPRPARSPGEPSSPGAASRSAHSAGRRRSTNTLALVPASAAGPSIRPLTVAGIDPFKDPAAYPLRTAGPQAAADVIDLTVGGDVMLGRRVATAAARTGDVSRPLRAIGPRLASADLTVVNLESTLSQAGTPQQGGDSFAAPPGVVAGLRDAGVDVLSLANNHTGDFEQRALLDTVRPGAGRRHPTGRGRRQPRRGRPAGDRGARRRALRLPGVQRDRRDTARDGDQPGRARLRMPPRTGPLNDGRPGRGHRCGATLEVGGRRGRRAAALGSAVHAHARCRRSARLPLRSPRLGPTWSIGGHPHWVQGVRVPAGQGGRALAGQPGVRHGLLPADPGRRAAGAHVLGQDAEGCPAHAVRDR